MCREHKVVQRAAEGEKKESEEKNRTEESNEEKSGKIRRRINGRYNPRATMVVHDGYCYVASS